MTVSPKPPAMDPKTVSTERGSGYPKIYASSCEGREKRRLGEAFGLKNFGVNLVRLEPSSTSALRHWHSRQDEFIYILEGEIALVTDEHKQTLSPGMIAGFPAGKPDGHHLINETDSDVWYLEVGDRTPGDEVDYPDIDMFVRNGRFVRADGSPYGEQRRQ